MKHHSIRKTLQRQGWRLLLPLAAFGWHGAASAQIALDVIGPHEYDLPVDFEPFNAFVQYSRVSDSGHVWNTDGDRVKADTGQVLVGLSKYVRFWTPSWNRKIGLAYEVLVPEVGIRNAGGTRSFNGGIGDPITGAAIWFKPSENATLGLQSFVQIPVGSNAVSDTNWKNLTSLFWGWQITKQVGLTGNGGFVWQSQQTSGFTPGLTLHINQRLGWRVHPHIEPFLGIDSEYTRASDGAPRAWAVDGGGGIVFHTFANQSITLRYSATLQAENHADNRSINLKYAYVWK